MPATDDILQRLRAGLPVSMDKLENPKILERFSHTRQLVVALNNSTDLDLARERLMEVIGTLVDASTFVMVPFYTNFGRHITLGRNIFINQNCTFLDLGGIIIEDDVIIGPRVKIISESYLAEDSQRKTLVPAAVTIRQGARIGAAAIISPGVTVGENSVVAPEAVVMMDVPDNVLVSGNPAKVVKLL